VAAAVVLALVATGFGMVFAQGGTDPTDAQPEAAVDKAIDKPQQGDDKARPERMKPLLAP
jgi:hypothetical protein